MARIEVNALLEPLSEDAPCGENLEYDAAFQELETAARGKPDQEIGDIKIPAEPPEWPAVLELAHGLAGRTKDLRLCIPLLRGALAVDGLPGMEAALALMSGYVARYWPTLHPTLDPDDDNDPTVRLNVIAELCDPAGLLRDLKQYPLSSSRQFGRFSWRDYGLAKGLSEAGSAGDAGPPELSTVEAAFRDTRPEVIERNRSALGSAAAQLAALESALNEAVGSSQTPDLKPFRRALADAKKLLDGFAAVTEDAVDETAAADGDDQPLAESRESAPVASRTRDGAVRSRADVVAALERICDYYRQFEPSSPMPLLLERAKRLVDMDFIAILEELAPDSVMGFRNIAGIR
ncbi:MAG TPA: type VI secretion system protein TssA [Aliidongia sp.]|nr:type VI secretion system protein TssA [Aliidongia sp.]